ncbi:MAG: 4Fe-4S binding protein [Planctomycetes bacterium]|nr:4Fe-4S binding protein [Planctomycetota bacterium]
MQHLFPVYTQETECQDCYKCVRECPVKAIRVENERAYIVAERCVACGRCVRICPSGAKIIRNDVGRVRFLIGSGTPVYASLAPSWVAVHPEWQPGQIIAALRRLGFAGVSETALGAQEVSAALANELSEADCGLHISSACPAVVDLVRKHVPELAGRITKIASPALTHCRMLREHFGPDIAVVFIGPCAAKKTEADTHPELMNLAITFAELDGWLGERSINPALINPGPGDVFVPEHSAEGALYPLEGGMVETMVHYDCPPSVRMQSISGLRRLADSLRELKNQDMTPPFFLEGLACLGGCVNGPCSTKDPSPIDGILAIRDNAKIGPPGKRPGLRVGMEYQANASPERVWNEAAIKEAMSRVGKETPEDELNCGACGYDTCRKFARALLSGDAETSMCASYMRSIAQRKANALLRCMPSGVVIVGSDLRIIESNEPFAAICGDETLAAFTANPGMAGAQVEDLLPIGKLLRAALRSGEDIKRERLKVNDQLLDIEIFIIEEHKTVGAIVDDVTQNEMRRDQIARRAREVINRNIATVQEIACRLGEHMADTEILLSSIAEGFSEDAEDGGTAP